MLPRILADIRGHLDRFRDHENGARVVKRAQQVLNEGGTPSETEYVRQWITRQIVVGWNSSSSWLLPNTAFSLMDVANALLMLSQRRLMREQGFDAVCNRTEWNRFFENEETLHPRCNLCGKWTGAMEDTAMEEDGSGEGNVPPRNGSVEI